MLRTLCAAGLMAAAAWGQAGPEEYFRAIRANDLKKLGELAANRAGVNAGDSKGMTPLLYASAFGSVEAMRLLLDAGADAKARNFQDATALHWSAWDPARVRLLLDRGADVNARTRQGRTALIIAAAIDGAETAVELLLARGASAKDADQTGITPLHGASARGDARTMRRLLKGSADPNAADATGFTPLMLASADGNVEAVKLLLERGARVNAANVFSGKVRHGEIALKRLTPLMLATPFGSPELVRALLDAGADVKARDVRGMTPLMLAVAGETQDVRVAKLLLDRGSEANARSGEGETVLDWARKSGNPEMLRALEKAGAKAGTAAPREVETAAVAKDARDAAIRGVGLLQRTSAEFFKQSGCIGCHHQPSTAIAVNKVRAAGLPVDERLAAEQAKAMPALMGVFQQAMLQRMELPGSIDQVESTAIGMLAYGTPADLNTDTMAAHLAMFQRNHGGWAAAFGISRAPVEERDIARTAYAARILRDYGWPGRKAEFDARLARARSWLLEAKPRTSYERAEQLLGLKWSGAGAEALHRAGKALLGEQRADGGWAQNRHLAADAYATGLALYALLESGVLAADMKAYQRGAAFLLRTQRADGSWLVRSRAPKFQPYFESGFPYGHDQWISATATAYATAALSQAAGSRRAALVRSPGTIAE